MTKGCHRLRLERFLVYGVWFMELFMDFQRCEMLKFRALKATSKRQDFFSALEKFFLSRGK